MVKARCNEPFSRSLANSGKRSAGYVELEDGEGFEPAAEYVREEAYEGLMPSIQHYATVGRLYEALRENLIASARRLGKEVLFIGPVEAQVGKDAIDLEGVASLRCDPSLSLPQRGSAR